MPRTREVFRFRDFELDVGAYELRKDGRAVRLERQPMDLLILLVERRGDLVSRSEIVDRLWGRDVFVDSENGINTAVRKIRQTLRDPAEAPAFVETVAGKGYRFIADVAVLPVAASPEPPPLATDAAPPPAGSPRAAPVALSARRPGRGRVVAGLALVGLVAGALLWAAWRRSAVADSVRIAVLPFTNLSGDPDREYLADGLAEETIASLGRVDPDHLQVIARTSTTAYRGTTKSVAEIGRDLGADYLVESSVRAEGGRLRITSKLIRVRDEVHVWSESFDREPVSMLGLQQELSAAIAEQIRLRLAPDRVDALTRRQTRNVDAYDLYLRGWSAAQQRTPAATRRAVEYYSRAAALDPGYALAWAGLAKAYGASQLNGDAPPMEVLPRAREAAARAIHADAGLSEAQLAGGYLSWCCDWDWGAAEVALRRAVVLDPRSAMGHLVLGHALSQMGRHAEASAEVARARELDPLQPLTHALSSQVAFQRRDHRAALEHARHAIVLDPGFWIGYMMRGQAHEQLGQIDHALEAVEAGARLSHNNSKTMALRAYVFARAGRATEARDVLDTFQAVSKVKYVPPYASALVHAGLGERDQALAWLERAYEARDVTFGL
jgi:TolB-like protein/DNA-binding winged helix-turn-helix (wHTH) protein/Flp pilus assembly protein TadD